MHFENLNSSASFESNNSIANNFISFKGLISYVTLFSIQAFLLITHITRNFGSNFSFRLDNFWSSQIPLLQLFAVYFGASLLFVIIYFSYLIGKGSTINIKDAIILGSFKLITVIVIFLIINLPIIINYLRMYTYAKFNYNFVFRFQEIFSNQVLPWISVIWLSLLVLFFSTKFIKYISKSFVSNKEENIGTTRVNHKFKEIPTKNNKVTSKDVSYENITETTQKNVGEISNNESAHDHIENEVDSESNNGTKENSKEDNFISKFLQQYFFVLSREDRFFWFYYIVFLLYSIFILNYTLRSAWNKYSAYNYITNSALLLFLIIIIFSYYYRKYLVKFNNYSEGNSKTESLAFGILGTIILIFYISLVKVRIDGYEYNYNSLVYFRTDLSIIFIFILVIPVIYLYYRKPTFKIRVNDIYSNHLQKFNPLSIYQYNRTISELNGSPKYNNIVKNFILLHKEDLKNSLYLTNPVTFKSNVNSVFLSDYRRLKTLLEYNGLSTISKFALVDFTMENFTGFLVNFEVAIQEYFTKELFTILNIEEIKVNSEFIDAKFSKIFTQWESFNP